MQDGDSLCPNEAFNQDFKVWNLSVVASFFLHFQVLNVDFTNIFTPLFSWRTSIYLMNVKLSLIKRGTTKVNLQ